MINIPSDSHPIEMLEQPLSGLGPKVSGKQVLVHVLQNIFPNLLWYQELEVCSSAIFPMKLAVKHTFPQDKFVPTVPIVPGLWTLGAGWWSLWLFPLLTHRCRGQYACLLVEASSAEWGCTPQSSSSEIETSSPFMWSVWRGSRVNCEIYFHWMQFPEDDSSTTLWCNWFKSAL